MRRRIQAVQFTRAEVEAVVEAINHRLAGELDLGNEVEDAAHEAALKAAWAKLLDSVPEDTRSR
jgi:hypothetical protein